MPRTARPTTGFVPSPIGSGVEAVARERVVGEPCRGQPHGREVLAHADGDLGAEGEAPVGEGREGGEAWLVEREGRGAGAAERRVERAAGAVTDRAEHAL